MKFELILSQGRVADKTARTLVGAELTAKAFEQRYGGPVTRVGKPSPPARDDWTVSLPQAEMTLRGLRKAIEEVIDRGHIPVLVSNTCPASIATLPVVAERYPEAVLLWIDAHGDFNTPATTDSGYLGGMVVAAGCGLWDSGHGGGLSPKKVVLVGARDIDPPEKKLLDQAQDRILPPKNATPDNLLAAIGDAPVWIHVDWDVLEPGYVPADYQVPHGLIPAQLRSLFEAIPREKILGFEVAEFNAPLRTEDADVAISNILNIFDPLFEAISPINA